MQEGSLQLESLFRNWPAPKRFLTGCVQRFVDVNGSHIPPGALIGNRDGGRCSFLEPFEPDRNQRNFGFGWNELQKRGMNATNSSVAQIGGDLWMEQPADISKLAICEEQAFRGTGAPTGQGGFRPGSGMGLQKRIQGKVRQDVSVVNEQGFSGRQEIFDVFQSSSGFEKIGFMTKLDGDSLVGFLGKDPVVDLRTMVGIHNKPLDAHGQAVIKGVGDQWFSVNFKQRFRAVIRVGAEARAQARTQNKSSRDIFQGPFKLRGCENSPQ